ncbi:iron-sulfur cluster assembly protein [Streptomyces sp. M19]
MSADSRERSARAALDTVLDPELDEPITDLGFVRSVTVAPDGALTVHLRLPTSFCSPNFAYLMASDSKDALTALPWTRDVVVLLDDHHDSDLINRGLAADAGYRGTFGAEAEKDLEALRLTFRRKAHAAAMERALALVLRENPNLTEEDLHDVVLGDLPDAAASGALLRRRAALGLGVAPSEPVLVDEDGQRYQPGRSRSGCASPVRSGCRSTATPISAGACSAPGIRSPRPTSPRVRGDRACGEPVRTGSPCARGTPPPHRSAEGERLVKAVQVVGYGQNLRMAEVPAPEITGPYDVIVRIGGAGVCRTDIHILEGQWAQKSGWRCPTRSDTRTPAGSTRSAAPSPMSPRATRSSCTR